MTLLQEVLARKRDPKPPEPHAAGQIRRAAGVSQERLARELGVARITVARWEAGTRTPRGALAVRYARLLSDLESAARDV